jgi:hypothetical protein
MEKKVQNDENGLNEEDSSSNLEEVVNNPPALDDPSR